MGFRGRARAWGVVLGCGLTLTTARVALADVPEPRSPAARAVLRRETLAEARFADDYRGAVGAFLARVRGAGAATNGAETNGAERRKLEAVARASVDQPASETDDERRERKAVRALGADETNVARGLVERGIAESDPVERRAMLEEALAHYRTAAGAWDEILRRDPEAVDAFEDRYWAADARHMVVVLLVALDREPSGRELREARAAAIAARDAKDDTYLQPSASMLVDLAHQELAFAQKKFDATHGAEGVERRTELETTGSAENTRVVKKDLPKELVALIAARDAYIESVPPKLDVSGARSEYALESANDEFAYGHFAEAGARYRRIFASDCNDRGYRAWERLITIATLTNDVDGARALAEEGMKRNCMRDTGTGCPGVPPHGITRGNYVEAARAFDRAENMSPGPERDRAWKEAADLYAGALAKGPERDEAPEAAFYGARAYKQMGRYDDALALLSTFVRAYGDAALLDKLAKGDASTTPPTAPDPAAFARRTKFLEDAEQQIAAAHIFLFDYASAAGAYEALGQRSYREVAERRASLRNAIILRRHLGDEPGAKRAEKLFRSLGPTAAEKADLDALFGKKLFGKQPVGSTAEKKGDPKPGPPRLAEGPIDAVLPPLPAMP